MTSKRTLLTVSAAVLVVSMGSARADTVYAYPSGNEGTLYAPEPDGSTTYFYGKPGQPHYGQPGQDGHTVYLYPNGNGGYYGHDATRGTDYYGNSADK